MRTSDVDASPETSERAHKPGQLLFVANRLNTAYDRKSLLASIALRVVMKEDPHSAGR